MGREKSFGRNSDNIFRTLNSFEQNFGMDFVHVPGFYNFEAHNLVLRTDVCTP